MSDVLRWETTQLLRGFVDLDRDKYHVVTKTQASSYASTYLVEEEMLHSACTSPDPSLFAEADLACKTITICSFILHRDGPGMAPERP